MTATTSITSGSPSFSSGRRRWNVLTCLVAGILVLSTMGGSVRLARAGITDDQADTIAAATFLIMARVIENDDGDVSLYAESPLGTGVLVSDDGLILTNHHVVDLDSLDEVVDEESDGMGLDLSVDDEQFSILAVDDTGDTPKRTFVAELVDTDPDRDLAILRIIGDEHERPLRRPVGDNRPAVLIRENPAREREAVTVFGYPDFGDAEDPFDNDAISAIENSIIDSDDGRIRRLTMGDGVGGIATIHINTTVSRGSSGGPVVDADGFLIGIVREAHEGASGGSETVAIPIQHAWELLDDAGWNERFAPTDDPDPTEAPTEGPDPTELPTETPPPTAPQKDESGQSQKPATSLVIMYDVSKSTNPSSPYHVRVWIDGDATEYANIRSVTWYLHPTFSPSVVYRDTAANGFLLEFDSYGEFEITAEVQFWDGTIVTLTGYLDYG